MGRLSGKAKRFLANGYDVARLVDLVKQYTFDHRITAGDAGDILGLTNVEFRIVSHVLRIRGYEIGSTEKGFWWCRTAEEVAITRRYVAGRIHEILEVERALELTEARLRCNAPHQERML